MSLKKSNFPLKGNLIGIDERPARILKNFVVPRSRGIQRIGQRSLDSGQPEMIQFPRFPSSDTSKKVAGEAVSFNPSCNNRFE